MDLMAATKSQADLATWVWWDITRCPVPTDVDARRVGPFIRRSLKSLGYNGAVNITAIGILTEIPLDVLQALSSTGINLYHVPTTDVKAVLISLMGWEWDNPHPANVMLISLQRIFGSWIADLSDTYYILGSKVPYDRKLDPSIFTRRAGCFLWASLLASLRADAADSNPAALEEECRGTGGSTFYCSPCDLGLLDFGDFKRHLQSKEHALEDLDYYTLGIDAADESLLREEDATAIQARLKSFRESQARQVEEEEKRQVEEEKKRQVEEEKLGYFDCKKRRRGEDALAAEVAGAAEPEEELNGLFYL